uniref:CCR4-Not complex component Not1 C-terminal domain-containing protein n=1 Tax=Oryza meridionalis TaxID=40149 RepID=A0A0E0F0Y1_9ORYZ
MIPFNSAVAEEVRSMVQGVDDSTFDSTHRELCQLADCSPDGCSLLLRVCLDEVLLNADVAKGSRLKPELLSTVFKYCLDKPYFSTSFCEALKTVHVSDMFLVKLSNELNLSAGERVGVGLALSDSGNLGLITKGQKFSIAEIEEICANPAHVLTNDQIHDIVVFLHQTDGLSKHVDSFTNIISLLNVKEMPFYVPAPIKEGNARPTISSRHMELYTGSLDDDFDSLLSEIGKEISMADIITELGYGCTSDIAHCKEILSLFEPLDDMGISKLLGAVVCTRVGLGEAHNTYSTFMSAVGNSQPSDSSQFTAWNIDVLVDSINEIAPRTNWITVVENLDHEGFCIPDEAAFCLLMSIYSRACKDPFPLHAVCGSLWKNTEGQLSFLKHAVAAPTDTFTFKHCSRKMVFPELANRMQGNQAWYCLDLLEVLCQLAELGYATMVRSMLDYPLIHCPDVLLLGVSHINTPYNLLQYEVLSCVFPMILKDTTYSSLMNSLWHVNPYLTLRGFVDSHSDANCLLRTVEICQDLTILSAVLDSTPFAFSIKLATVAFRQSHSNLEKWLVEKLTAQGETFLEECVKFLKEIMSNTTYETAEGAVQQHQAMILDICRESCPLIMKVLQSHSGQLLSNQLVEELRRVEAVHESRNHGVVGRDAPTSEGGPDDIEAQANIYFHQMFSGQISVDAMVQMLARFKESTNKRELSIFNCMVSNLFEEYKFFPKYPDTQLKLAAVLMVNSKSLNKEMVKATYENCKVLLQSDLIKSSSEERSLLKNLGSWLGKFTIGRNQTLRAKEIDPKILIIEAYERGLMIAVIPFTSKILEPCQSSIAYRPPNPWTMGILSLLVEIYNLPNLKMNLKFDIEVLFKNLSVDMKDVKPSSLLKDRIRQIEGNPDFSNKDVSASQAPVVAEVSSGVMPTINHVEPQPEINSTSRATSLPNMLSQYAAPLRLPTNNMVEDDKAALIMPEQVSSHGLSQLMAAIPRADIYFRINEKLSSFGSLQYSKIMDMALDKAIKEIIGPVIQRSVTIASRTTKELILKDYAMEADDSAVSRSAHLMVGTLAGSLAHVTSKEPLRVALSSHLRSLIQSITNNTESTEQIMLILVNDNLDLGCALIETVATRKAVEMIDGEIKQPFSQLRRQKELLGSAYYDAFPYTQGLKRVPDALRPKPTGHLSAAQRRVYEDFITVWHSQSSQNAGGSATATAMAVAPSNSSVPRVYSPNSALTDSSSFSSHFASASQTTELVHEESDRNAHLSSLSSKIGASDTSTQVIGTTNVASVFPPMVPNDLPVGEPTTTNKDLVTSAPLSPTTAVDRMGSVFAEPLNTSDALERYQQVSQKLDTLIAKDGKDAEIQSVIVEVPDILLKCVSRDEAALAIAQKVFRSLYDNASNSNYVTWLLAALVAIRDVCKLVVKELTSWVIYSDEDKKFNIDIVIGLIRSELLNLGDYNVHLAKIIDGGRNKAATEFAISLVQTLITQESISISEVYNVVDALSKLAIRPSSPESLQQLIEIARSFASVKDENIRQSRDKKVLSGRPLMNKEENNANDVAFTDAVGFQEKVAVSFSEWCNICDHPTMGDSAYTHYIVQLQQDGLLKGDDLTDRFYHILTELAVAHSVVSEQVVAPGGISQQPTQQLQISYFSIDSYSKLVALVVKYSSVDIGPSKGSLFNKILSVIVRIIQRDAEEKKVLTAFANAFHVLQPLRVPAWRSFMPKLLLCNAQKGWPFFQRLLVDLFKFMEPYLRNAELGQPIHLLYKGTLRVLLVLLHDFPEFLCDYHFSFCDVIPPSCIQMRNVILSAFPRNMRLPDPSTPNLKIDLLAEISIPPRIMSDVDGALKSKQMKTQVDEYLKRPDGSFLTDLKQKLLLPQNEANIAGTRYNVPLVNSLVLYVGMQAVQQLQLNKMNASASAQQMNQSQLDVQIETATELFRNLVMNSDTEGRYLLLNAIANQLRYPNNHTHYFSFIILYLFSEANQEIVQEQITRVLLERLIVNRPHPWGLLITFIELIKNPRYSFWARSFTRCAPEIEKLFESVARSCGGKGGDDGVGLPDGGH